MTFDHRVKVNGIWVEAGVEVDSAPAKPNSATKVVEKVEKVVEEPKKTYKKSDIFKMNKSTLLNVCKENGIENVDDKTGSELKNILYGFFNL